MDHREQYDEEALAQLLRLLPPAPEAAVEAAQELPRVRRGIDQILALAESDAEFRRDLIGDLEEALRRAGMEPSPERVRGLRARLGGERLGGEQEPGAAREQWQ